MEIDKDDVTIVGTAVAWLVTIFLGGRSYEKLSSRVGVLEELPPCVAAASCEERRSACAHANELQFEHGAEVFAELRKEMAAIRADSRDQHREIMQSLRKMNT